MSGESGDLGSVVPSGYTYPEDSAQARQRMCPGCGRRIDWEAVSCPYCAWTQDTAGVELDYGERISRTKRIGLYMMSLLVPIAGIVVGFIYIDRPGHESQSVGKKCLILGAVSILVSPSVFAAILYFMVIGM